MSIKRVLRGNEQGKTGWEHLKSWWNDEDEKPDLRSMLKQQFNPLGLFLGDMLEFSDLAQRNNQAYEVESILCFKPIHGGDRVTRYEFKGSSPVCSIEALESPEGVLYTWYELDDEFETDTQLLNICKNDDHMEHTLHDGDDEHVTRYFKDAEMESQAMIFSEQGFHQVRLYGFYYSDESENKFLSIEHWPKAKWMRFYIGKNISQKQSLSLGSL